MKNLITALFLLFFSLNFAVFAQNINYKIKFEAPQTHYASIQLNLSDLKSNEIEIIMPVWAPGSYLVREFSKHIENVSIKNSANEPIAFKRNSKNSWSVSVPKDKIVFFSYELYANELTVRTNFIDENHAYLNPVAVFPYIKGLEKNPATLTISPFSTWKKISTALPAMSSEWERKIDNYDDFADSPIEIGNHEIFDFTVANVPHKVAVFGGGNYNPSIFTEDFKKIVEETTKIFGENPCKTYTFIVHSIQNGSGGLEHKNSTTLQTRRNAYNTESGKRNLLALVAHEYFHLWNVKRLRPQELGPFDYSKENYTRQLWFSEGVTSYYDEMILLRAGYVDINEYLQSTFASIDSYEKNYGKNVQSVAEASYDAWVKFYRPNENSPNSTVSYYTKGAILGLLLDLEIAHRTKGEKNLDDFMRVMYDEFFKKRDVGFSEDDFKNTLNKVTNSDMSDFLSKYVYGLEALPYEQNFKYAGVPVIKNKSTRKSSGLKLKTENGKTTVSFIARESNAFLSGLSVGDEIIAINGNRINSENDFLQIEKEFYTNSAIKSFKFHFFRDGLLKEIDFKTEETQEFSFSFFSNKLSTDLEKKVFEKVFGKNHLR